VLARGGKGEKKMMIRNTKMGKRSERASSVPPERRVERERGDARGRAVPSIDVYPFWGSM
jgi:hypothetical protein